MKIEVIYPPFEPDFEALIQVLYKGPALQIKQSQPYSSEFLVAGFLLRGDEGQVIGRAALYLNPSLNLEGQPALALGAYECVEDADAATVLLEAVVAYANSQFPHHALVGPMDGSTWQSYRFVSGGLESGPFLFEPFALPYYPEQWAIAGFAPLMEYVSNLAKIHESQRMDYQGEQALFESKGLVFRNLDAENPEMELRRMAAFNGIAFGSAFLFTAISEAEFVEKNRKIMAFLDPNLVHVVLDGDVICGMILAYPDKLDPGGRSAVVKTLARLPGDRYRGLGELLCAKIVNTLLDKGFDRMVHALMRADNPSLLNSSRFWGEPYKRYVLFSRKPDSSILGTP